MDFKKEYLIPCPVVKPTLEEFGNPVEYLSRADIAHKGQEYGILKVIPPSNWNPMFLIAESFRFHTRKQKLSDLGLTARSRKFFTDNLNRFLQMRRRKPLGLSFVVDKNQDLDGQQGFLIIYYYDLYLMVEKNGGYAAMDHRKWATVAQHFGVSDYQKLRQVYENDISSYARFLSDNQNLANLPESDSEDENDSCLICKKHNSPSQTLLCDNCDNAFHLQCILPNLTRIPLGKWYCNKCLIGTGEYGFEEQVDLKYSIPEFYQVSQQFKRQFEADYNHGVPLTEDDMEKKFWKFVELEKSDLEVRYGADIHNFKPGEISGFPMANSPNIAVQNPLVNYYVSHPWNLTRLPFAKGSLLNYINTSISGMTIPWIYIGSLFSTFCWHVEDHYTLSANYCHFGATKKWYAIPEYDADKFEKLMKESAPDLFQRQPDLLHQLVTLLSPIDIIRNGVKCVYCDQKPNEFVITYPRVYHAGFNCGFNFNEAVNFTMDTWINYGRKSINDYKQIGKECVFDYYALVENILRDENIFRNRERKNLVSQCLRIFEEFALQQSKYLKLIDLGHFDIQFVPRPQSKRLFEDEQMGFFAGEESEDENDLCDLCRTKVSYQYCIINNKKHRFIPRLSSYSNKRIIGHRSNQLLTPNSSPLVVKEVEQSDHNKMSNLSQSSAAKALDALRSKTDESSYGFSSSAKRNLTESDSSTKRRKSSRLLNLKETPSNNAMAAVQLLSQMKRLTEKKTIPLCLQCVLNLCGDDMDAIPPGSQLLCETPIELMFDFIKTKKEDFEAIHPSATSASKAQSTLSGLQASVTS